MRQKKLDIGQVVTVFFTGRVVAVRKGADGQILYTVSKEVMLDEQIAIVSDQNILKPEQELNQCADLN